MLYKPQFELFFIDMALCDGGCHYIYSARVKLYNTAIVANSNEQQLGNEELNL